MTENDYHQLLDALLRKRVELRNRTAAILEDSGIHLSPDASDRAIELENSDILNELAREAIEELSKINMALARDKAGQYGLCINCGAEIPTKRLRAVPWAAHCITCAIKNEVHRLR